MRELSVGMKRERLRRLGEELISACDAHPEDESIEVMVEAEFNGNGPSLLLCFNNDDMEGDHIASAEIVVWDE